VLYDILLKSHLILIASETGLMHIAGAIGMPLIGLFKSADPENWFPYNNKNQLAIPNKFNSASNTKIENFKNKKLNIQQITTSAYSIIEKYETSEKIHYMQNHRN
jgi:ADP-heptose:LPS heptosyltransferase